MKDLLKMLNKKKQQKLIVEALKERKPRPKRKTTKYIYEWHTPEGTFDSLEKAAKANSRSQSYIQKRCQNCQKMILPHPAYPEEWFGKTWEDIGYYVVKKENRVS